MQTDTNLMFTMTDATEEDVMAISEMLMTKNANVYKELAK